MYGPLHLSYSNEPVMKLDFQMLLKSPPPVLTSWTRPCFKFYPEQEPDPSQR